MDGVFGVMVELLNKAGQKREGVVAQNAQDPLDGQGIVDSGHREKAAVVFAVPS